MSKIFVVVEEDTVEAKAVYASADREKCLTVIQRDYAQELRKLADNLFRCGSSVVTIQEVEVD